MLFRGKLERLLPKEKQEEKRRQFQDELKDQKLEKGDLPAMILAALLVYLPVVLLVGGVLAGIMWLLFAR
ncbi:MAG TPA: hypothetical protein IAA58_01040 [Candidatus Gallacutalibacter stercoravium]|nr:hypothetical protein [Candidatus Gallacutalibacter stercoravium]